MPSFISRVTIFLFKIFFLGDLLFFFFFFFEIIVKAKKVPEFEENIQKVESRVCIYVEH